MAKPRTKSRAKAFTSMLGSRQEVVHLLHVWLDAVDTFPGRALVRAAVLAHLPKKFQALSDSAMCLNYEAASKKASLVLSNELIYEYSAQQQRLSTKVTPAPRSTHATRSAKKKPKAATSQPQVAAAFTKLLMLTMPSSSPGNILSSLRANGKRKRLVKVSTRANAYVDPSFTYSISFRYSQTYT
ncbi:hypothetical protein Gpo141_00002884 [Globisporangium polare]